MNENLEDPGLRLFSINYSSSDGAMKKRALQAFLLDEDDCAVIHCAVRDNAEHIKLQRIYTKTLHGVRVLQFKCTF